MTKEENYKSNCNGKPRERRSEFHFVPRFCVEIRSIVNSKLRRKVGCRKGNILTKRIDSGFRPNDRAVEIKKPDRIIHPVQIRTLLRV